MRQTAPLSKAPPKPAPELRRSLSVRDRFRAGTRTVTGLSSLRGPNDVPVDRRTCRKLNRESCEFLRQTLCSPTPIPHYLLTGRSPDTAGHFNSLTNIGAGLAKALELIDEEGRPGAQQCILLMTDGLPNVAPHGFTLPAGWNWAARFDDDNNGTADDHTTHTASQYALYQASLAADRGITVHAMAVGGGADIPLMRAIAHMSGGLLVVVPAGTSLTSLQTQLREAFSVIAGRVPPARLVHSAD